MIPFSLYVIQSHWICVKSNIMKNVIIYFYSSTKGSLEIIIKMFASILMEY